MASRTDCHGNQTYFLDNGLSSYEKLTDRAGKVAATHKYKVFVRYQLFRHRMERQLLELP